MSYMALQYISNHVRSSLWTPLTAVGVNGFLEPLPNYHTDFTGKKYDHLLGEREYQCSWSAKKSPFMCTYLKSRDQN